MSQFIFIGKQKNTQSKSDFEQLKFENIDPIQYKFTIFNQTQSKPYPSKETLMFNEDTNKFKKGGTINYDLEFEDYNNSTYDYKITGQIVKIEKENLRQYYYEQLYGWSIIDRPVQNVYKLTNLWCGGTFIIYKDQTALLISHGSGMHYVSVLRGYIKPQ